jgi:vesicle coat complex subunit
MSVLNRIAYFQNRRDEVPNQELARELAETKNKKGIQEIAENLYHKNQNVQSDCLKVLYEIGYLAPELIADYVDDFLKLLKSKNNRMVWGGMIALATIAETKPREIWKNGDDVIDAIDHGTLITLVWGIKTLARVASTNKQYRAKLFPILIQHLKTCIPRDVPTHAESVLCAVDDSHKDEFLSVLESRRAEMTPSQLTRLRRITKQLEAW